MNKLTPAQQHVIARCSTVDTWDRTGRTFGRQWPDLVAGRSHVSFKTIKALIARGLIYEDADHLFGLTDEGVRAWIGLSTELKVRAA